MATADQIRAYQSALETRAFARREVRHAKASGDTMRLRLAQKRLVEATKAYAKAVEAL